MGFLDDLGPILGGVGGFALGGPGGAALGAGLGSALGGTPSAPSVNQMTGLIPGLAGGSLNTFAAGTPQAAANAARANLDLLNSGGRTSSDLFNRILAGSSRGTEASQAGLRARGARSGVDSGIQDALAAAIDMEGADREGGIRAQEASLAEQRRRQDLSGFTANVLDPLLASLGIEAGVATNRANVGAQQGNQEMQAIAALLGGLTNL